MSEADDSLTRAGSETATVITYEDRFGRVGMVLVHPDQRRHRIGTALLECVIRYLQEKDIGCVKLDVTLTGLNVYLPLGLRRI